MKNDKASVEVKKCKSGGIYARIIEGNIVYLYLEGKGIGAKTSIELIWKNSDENIEKTLFFYGDSDYLFNGEYLNEEDIKDLEFMIDKNNLLYKPLQLFLSEKNEIIIEDDATVSDEKLMSIKKEEDNILIAIKNHKKDEDDILNTNHIFIKNSMYDLRSKIDRQGLDTKERLR